MNAEAERERLAHLPVDVEAVTVGVTAIVPIG